MANIGFIGLGHMGQPMALNLLKSGHQVSVFDINPQALEALEKQGATLMPSVAALAGNQQVLITMLQTGEQVAGVCLGQEGLFQNASPNTLHIDCSSIDVASSRKIHQSAMELGLLSLDAPVSGGVKGAEQASLTFMVGGNHDVLEQARPILACMGKNIIHTGAAGNGQAAKICNNMILGISMIAISESFSLGQSLGLAPEKLHEVASKSSGQCWAMSHYVPVPGILDQVPANNDYKPGFTAAMMLKDLLLSQQAASQTQQATPLGEHAKALYQEFVNSGQGELDFSAIIKLLNRN